MIGTGKNAAQAVWRLNMSNERVIKKYANRRLYDSTGSRHVTLDDLRKMIVSGDKVKVIDDKSGEDLTRAVLLQVIAEQEQFGTPVLSLELMESLRAQGVAATISGAGPTVLALTDATDVYRVGAAAGPGWRVERLAVDAVGATARVTP